MLFPPVLPFQGCSVTPVPKRAHGDFDEDDLFCTTEVRMPSGGFSTPKKAARKNHQASCHSGPSTPVSKHLGLTTPPVPDFVNKRAIDDIDAALLQGSLPLLSLALLRHHKCLSDHCLHEAIMFKNASALSFLLRNGAHGVDEQCAGRRPLHLAVCGCMVEGDAGYNMAKMLLQNLACPDKCAEDDQAVEAPMFDATRRGCAAAVKLLLCHGAKPDAVDASGRTVLHTACQKVTVSCELVQWQIISLLLKHGASPYKADAHGKMPAEYLPQGALLQKLRKAQQVWTRCQLAWVGGRAAVQGSCFWQMDEFTDHIASFT